MGWTFIVFLPFMVTMMVLAASTAFYHHSSHSRDDDLFFGRQRLYQWFQEGPNMLNDFSGKTPLEIAQERYAKGEMTHEEFDRMVERLKESRHTWQKW
ncbi:SHOCT domain-containing protein [Sulfobacillus thermosulfidooxidans]|uniref:Short C-terminal domain-containing protein n=2 Tax=Sulfobacillus thermosulfidooxidans TaxID=28034 RepID=A0A1W1WJ54_SULTA|nr:SHOCT domain-containing protein [Sulfobacillus thermosulfidooxidans]OLZ08493.1 hypothetical protein BFX05_02885 [Sulfobacillus thermosulfidooxidans]OLZ13096.1 hypothetical protein BFX06_11135 [Sulfobacillus thermosulfidooxidans]OLZ21476.1 hypothetical protein BFX07_11560 [Sulfobacillus thermosulfidooxidans]PSR29173.1 MAG: SHOCT domain-containing protein [Sulfobacillus thermosulfidooxidans]SMC06275.1 Short C-terminal domain-containing protein [Sulfobacillus thermosulfidooxidans DSM 9293]